MQHILFLFVMLTLSGCAYQSNSDMPIDVSDRARVLAADLAPSSLRDELLQCGVSAFAPTEFSISHRGAPLGYPEHTREGYLAAATMGAGVIECDVTFTRDHELVCRHSQCDLHSTTNILQTPLADQCSEPFRPATAEQPASAKCCTSDLTLDQFRTLCGRRDVVNRQATTVDEYLNPPLDPRIEPWRNRQVSCGTLLTHAESITLINASGRAFTPELKSPMVPMPHDGLTQAGYADKMINEYRKAGIEPSRVYPQSFNINDVNYWISQHPEFGQQAVYLDPRGRNPDFQPTLEGMQALKRSGVNIIAPPMPMLLRLAADGSLEPSNYAQFAKQAGLEIITWTFESGDPTSPQNWLYTGLHDFMQNEASMLQVLDVLAQQVGIRGIFSDWPGTVTYYAACRND